jgi:hypothetical protein
MESSLAQYGFSAVIVLRLAVFTQKSEQALGSGHTNSILVARAAATIGGQ